MKAIQTDFGWGYDIYTNDSIYIHQEYMPAVQGRKGFATAAEAETVANVIIAKMKNRRLPTISLAELDSCGITR